MTCAACVDAPPPPSQQVAAPVARSITIDSVDDDPRVGPIEAIDIGSIPWIAAQIAALDSPLVIDAWLQTHPRDQARLHRPQSKLPHVVPGPWCARSVTNVRLRDEREWVRHAYFQEPRLRPGVNLPPIGDTAALAVRHCEVGAVAIELLMPYPEGGVALVDSLALELERQLGAHATLVADAHLYSGLDRWPAIAEQSRAARVWQRGPTTIIMAYLALGAMGEVVVAAWDSTTELRIGGTYPTLALLRAAATDPIRRRSLERWIDRANHPAQAVALREILAGVDRWLGDSTIALSDSALGDALFAWIVDTAGLEPMRRTATLLAAHDVLTLAEVPYGLKEPGARGSRDRLERVGVEFTSEDDEGRKYYDGSLFHGAIRAAGPAADDSILAYFVVRGFAVCGVNSEQVIQVGEALLPRVMDQAIKATIHLAVANAYRNLVRRSYSKPWYDETPSDRYAARAPDARRRAIEHYREVFAVDAQSPGARKAWHEAWRLLAELPPRYDGSYCDRVD